MMSLLQVFVDIVLRRKGPQDLPASPALLAGMIVLYAGIGFAFSQLVPQPDDHAFQRLAVNMAFGLAWTWGILAFYKRSSRFLQTSTALTGTALILQPLLLGLQLLVLKLGQSHPLLPVVMVVLVIAVIWFVSVNIHILRAALEVGVFAAFLLTLVSELLALGISLKLFPVTAAS